MGSIRKSSEGNITGKLSSSGSLSGSLSSPAGITGNITGTGGGSPPATVHTLYFEFTDETDTTITAYYDDEFISDAIKATAPKTYGNKTVSLAQLDNVTWYELSNIPLYTELVDFNAVISGYRIDDSGDIVEGNSWDCVTDYIPIDPMMTFTCKCREWTNVALYDSNKNSIVVTASNYIEGATGEGTLQFTIAPPNIPSNVAYIVLVGNAYSIDDTLSVIRTA